MDSSEVSVPRQKYPPCIKCCDVSAPAGASDTELWDRHGTAIPYYCVRSLLMVNMFYRELLNHPDLQLRAALF